MTYLTKIKGLYLIVYAFYTLLLLREVKCIIEQAEPMPLDLRGVVLGEFSMPQFLIFCMLFLLLVLLYAVKVVPIEIDLGYFVETGSTDLFPRSINSDQINFMKIAYDCPLQYVCELDSWANREDHEYYIEKLIASWFKNSNSRYNNTKAIEFGGTGTCQEMHPCPFDIQDFVGVPLTKSNQNINLISNNEVDMQMDFMS